MNNEFKSKNPILLKHLRNLSALQFKIFFTALVHYWFTYKVFITKQSLFNLWCELNLLCHALDDSFPDQYDDRETIKSFCRSHPYYFIDRLPLDLVAGLFAEHVDDRIDILAEFVRILSEADVRAAYTYVNEALQLTESVDTLISETENHINQF